MDENRTCWPTQRTTPDETAARVKVLEEALKLLLGYTEQVELLAYSHGERAIKHPVVHQAIHVLRGKV